MRPLRLLLSVVAVACALAVFMVVTSFVQGQMNHLRASHELTETTPLENAPPIVAFTTVALGGFRGLLADYLWLRQNRIQEEGNYFEMVQLGSWIIKLQPRFTGAAAFLGWNMAYNISVTFNDYEDRWRWVQRGIELIRDEALVYNPADPLLFKELSWIYLHKLGQDMDDANRYYKTKLALQVGKTLGTYPPDWQGLASAPLTESTLHAALGSKTEFWKLLGELQLSFDEFEARFRETGKFPDSFPLDRLTPADRTTVELSLRSRWLRAAFKLDPALIVEMNRKYGNFDWRLPQAHGIYFALRGLAYAPGNKDLNCERNVFQGLNAAFKGGRLVYARDIGNFETTPNLDLLAATNQAYVDSMTNHEENSSVKAGYENFLIDTTVILFTFGKEKQASEFLQKLRDLFAGNAKYKKRLEDFVLTELAEDMGSATTYQAQATVQGFLLEACKWLVFDETERAAAYEKMALACWKKYMNDLGEGSKDRRGLPPIEQMKKVMIEDISTSGRYPPAFVASIRQVLGLPPMPAPPPPQPPRAPPAGAPGPQAPAAAPAP